jgi:preprotein translocase SecE subunit
MNVAQQFISYLRSSKEEFKKVSWPSRRDTVRYSALVIGMSVLVSALFGGLDAGFGKLVDSLIALRASSKPALEVQGASQPIQAVPVQNTNSAPTPSFDINAAPIETPKK